MPDFVTSLSFLRKRLAFAFTRKPGPGHIPFPVSLKGQRVSQEFKLQVFSWAIFPQAPKNKFWVISNFLENFGDIRKLRRTTGINDTGGKFVTNINHTGAKFSTGTAGVLPLVSITLVANNGSHIILLTPKSELKNLSIC
jgi:hypothetical protein